MTVKTKDKAHVAYLITWTESEKGWGIRPDGASLHLTQDNAKVFLKEYWDGMPAEAPHEFSRNDNATGSLVAVSPDLYAQLKGNKKHSVRLSQTELNAAMRKGDIKE
jgi:hypothetical protein